MFAAFKSMVALVLVWSSQLAERLGACVSCSLVCAFSSFCFRQMKSFPADVLEDRAGEVVYHRIQPAVEIGQANGDVKCNGQVFQGRTDLRFLQGVDCFIGLDPNQHLHEVAREEANDEEHRHHCDEVQSLLNLCLLGQLSLSQVDNYVDCAVDNHEQRQNEGKEKPKLMPDQIALRFGVNHEALAVVHLVFQREDMSCHCNGEQPEQKCSTHGFGDTHRVDRMMGMHHTHVPVQSNSHQEDSTAAAVQLQHEEADVADDVSKLPGDPRIVVAGTERQSHVEQKISHCQVEE